MGRLLAGGRRGDRIRVFAASTEGGSEAVVEFLEELSEPERTRMVRLFEKLAAGHRLSKEDFRQVRGKIYEFKDHRRRMMCFSTPEGWFVTHGFEKKTNDATPERQIERAERIMQEHLRAQGQKKDATGQNEQRHKKKRKR
jgi:phage-related protein